MGRGRDRCRIVGTHIPHWLARSGPGDSRLCPVRRCHRSLRDGRLCRCRPATQARYRPWCPCRCVDVRDMRAADVAGNPRRATRIAATTWSRLCELAGGEDIAAWTRSLPEREAVETLQAEGIAAGVLQDIQDLMEDDPGLAKRGALMDIVHARLGRFGHVRTPISFSRDRIEAFRAPNLGEHSREIAGLAGMDAGRFESLESLGVFR